MFYAVLGLIAIGALLAAAGRGAKTEGLVHEAMLLPHENTSCLVIHIDLLHGVAPVVYGTFKDIGEASHLVATSHLGGTFQFYDLASGQLVASVHK